MQTRSYSSKFAWIDPFGYAGRVPMGQVARNADPFLPWLEPRFPTAPLPVGLPSLPRRQTTPPITPDTTGTHVPEVGAGQDSGYVPAGSAVPNDFPGGRFPVPDYIPPPSTGTGQLPDPEYEEGFPGEAPGERPSVGVLDWFKTQGESEMAVDWGEFLSSTAQAAISGFVGGVGTPPIVGTGPAATPPPAKVTVDTRTGEVTECKRRRRRRLLTESDFNDLMRISTLPNKQNVSVALAKAVGRR